MRTGGNLEPRKDEKVISLLFVSEDKGLTWRYFSTVADPSVMTADARRRDPEDPRYQGRPWPQDLLEASETSMIQLADGDLMAVFRVGHFLDLGRTYSSDGGRSWSQVEPIPPFSVAPSMVRTRNDTIVLSSGRPGLRVWFSTDARAQTWQDIDILEHHNRWAPGRQLSHFPAGPNRRKGSDHLLHGDRGDLGQPAAAGVRPRSLRLGSNAHRFRRTKPRVRFTDRGAARLTGEPAVVLCRGFRGDWGERNAKSTNVSSRGSRADREMTAAR